MTARRSLTQRETDAVALLTEGMNAAAIEGSTCWTTPRSGTPKLAELARRYGDRLVNLMRRQVHPWRRGSTLPRTPHPGSRR